MTISKVEQNELPEYLVVGTVIKGYKTADGTGSITLLAAGHHPKIRIVRAGVTLLAGAAQVQATITKGDGTTTLVSGLNSGTTSGVTTEGTVDASKYLDRYDSLLLVPSAAGTTVTALFWAQLESID